MDANNIYSGPVYSLSLWDSTNYQLLLGYVGADVDIKQRPLAHNLIDGNDKQYSVRTSLEAELLESNPEKIGELYNRQGTLQDIFIVVEDRVFKFSDVYVSFQQVRPFGSGFHKIVITAQTEIQKNFNVITNLLSSWADGTNLGGFEDANPPSGWNSDGTLSRTAKFNSGLAGSYALTADVTAADEAWASLITFPVEAKPITMVWSSYAKTSGAYQITVSILELDNAAGTLATHTSTTLDVSSASSGSQITYTTTFTPDADIAYLQLRIAFGSSVIYQFDAMQLQLKALSTYTENENV